MNYHDFFIDQPPTVGSSIQPSGTQAFTLVIGDSRLNLFAHPDDLLNLAERITDAILAARSGAAL